MALHRDVLKGSAALRFGPFQILKDRQLLLSDGAEAALGSCAFDPLLALVRGPGELIRKAEFIASVWPGSRVDEVNLRVQLSLLCGALGGGAGSRGQPPTVAHDAYTRVPLR